MWGFTASFLSTLWTLFFAASRFHHVAATTGNPSFFPQGFTFDWNPDETSLPIPVTQQCETLHIKWGRGSESAGPDPVPPYFLQIFSSAYIVPFIIPAGSGLSFDFQVPFSPGTQYQICMWDSLGKVSGGCQNLYTVIPNSSATSQNPATCPNVTFSHPPLQANAIDSLGTLSQIGWPAQCTDIQVQAKNGTGPYTLTIAPTLHPPLNITPSNGGPINWTVSLSHGSPFFILVTDSQGNSWSQGPLHSGDNADTACLNVNHSPDGSSGHSSVVPATIGASVGGILVGVFAGALAFKRWRDSRKRREHWENPIRSSLGSSDSRNPREMTTTSRGGREFLVEPFGVASTLRSSSPGNPGVSPPPGSDMTNPTTSPVNALPASGSSDPADSSGRRPNVYVVHHDGGRAPVTVYTEEGAAVVELPPQYVAGNTSMPSPESGSMPSPASDGMPSPSDPPQEVDRRRPGTKSRKTREPRSVMNE